MRCGFEGLPRITTVVITQDPLSGLMFVFRNRRGDRQKILYWLGDGDVLWYRRSRARAPIAPKVDVGPGVPCQYNEEDSARLGDPG